MFCCNILKHSTTDSSVDTKNCVSSSYPLILTLVSGLISGKGVPLISVLLLIPHARGYACSIKSSGLTGHHCFMDLRILKYVLRNPFVRIEVLASLKSY